MPFTAHAHLLICVTTIVYHTLPMSICSLQTRTSSNGDMDKNQQEQQQETSSPIHQHANLFSRLLQQTAAASSSSMPCHYTPRQHKHHFHCVSSKTTQ